MSLGKKFKKFKNNLFLSKFNGNKLRFLSKNNNNCKRINFLLEDKKSKVVLILRNPIDTARSLHNLHKIFSSNHSSSFERKYLNWLGHFEFGIDHLPMKINNLDFISSSNANDLQYWIDYWKYYYSGIIELIKESDAGNLIVVNYEDLCRNPIEACLKIKNFLGIQGSINSKSIIKKEMPEEDLHIDLLNIYNEIKSYA